MSTGGGTMVGNRRAARAFTLVEILIVVVILGILAAVAVPQFARASLDARKTATVDALTKIRRALDVYFVRHSNQYPNIVAGDGTWGELVDFTQNTYLREVPINQYVGMPNGKQIAIGTGPDTSYQTTHGWIYDPTTGQVWAGSFDASGNAFAIP